MEQFFRGSFTAFFVGNCLWGAIVSTVLGAGVFLASDTSWVSSESRALAKTLKALFTLITGILFIPIVDSAAFGAKCAFSPSAACLAMTQSYRNMAAFSFAGVLFLSVVSLNVLLSNGNCQIYGGLTAQPHPRCKLLKLFFYVIIILSYYFITTEGKEIVYLLLCFIVGGILSYLHIQYIPLFNARICVVVMASFVVFTTAAFCALVGELSKYTGQTNPSVTILL